jgi:hypothetical protein
MAVLSEDARTALRFALARNDAFRTPEIGFELEQAISKRIFSVHQHPDNPLVVVVELADGTVVELVKQPAEVTQHAASRERRRPQRLPTDGSSHFALAKRVSPEPVASGPSATYRDGPEAEEAR